MLNVWFYHKFGEKVNLIGIMVSLTDFQVLRNLMQSVRFLYICSSNLDTELYEQDINTSCFDFPNLDLLSLWR